MLHSSLRQARRGELQDAARPCVVSVAEVHGLGSRSGNGSFRWAKLALAPARRALPGWFARTGRKTVNSL